MVKSSIHLKAYRRPDGREVHYAASRLRRAPGYPAAVIDPDDPGDDEVPPPSRGIAACWVFFYPAGANRRLLGPVVSRYSPKFECDGDVLFLCVNRPGKGGTSPDRAREGEAAAPDGPAPEERRHIRAACEDVAAVLDHHGVSRASLFYMCAGSTFALSFAARFPGRATGYVVGISSWVLRSGPSSPDGRGRPEKTPRKMNPLIHRMAMDGYLGPRWMVSWLAGGIMGSVNTIVGSAPLSPTWVGNQFKKELSEDEVAMFDERYPDGERFIELMRWIRDDEDGGEASVFVNGDANDDARCCEAGAGDSKEGDARDIAVCLSTQQDVGLVYEDGVPPLRRVLLWHGEWDRMVSVAGAGYLASMIPEASLTMVPRGTHQGVMFFFPEDAMEALNRISRDVPV